MRSRKNTMARLDELQEKMQSKEYGPSVDPIVPIF